MKLTHPLALTSSNSKQCNNVYAALYPAIMLSKEFNRYWLEQLRYGQRKYSEIGLLDLEVEREFN